MHPLAFSNAAIIRVCPCEAATINGVVCLLVSACSSSDVIRSHDRCRVNGKLVQDRHRIGASSGVACYCEHTR